MGDKVFKDFAGSVTALAHAVGYSRNTLQSWVRKRGAPKKQKKGYHIPTWEGWIEDEGLGQPDSGTSAKNRKDIAQALFWESKAKKESEQLIDRQELKDHLIPLIAKVRRLLDSRFLTELPIKQEGLTAIEIREMNSEALDAVYEILSKI